MNASMKTNDVQVAQGVQEQTQSAARAANGAQVSQDSQMAQGSQEMQGARGQTRSGVRAACDIASVFSRQVKAVYRLCYSYLGSSQDAEDATQVVFLKLLEKPRTFESDEHEKAWLLTVAANHCKDVLKSAARTRSAEMPPDVEDPRSRVERSDVLEAVLALPPLYKDCVYLHYYEGYKTDEIARMTGAPPSTVRNRLRDARALLKAAL